MRTKEKFPLGVQSFVSLRQGNFIYADKTKYIYDLAMSGTQYFLCRPRRFGKSLFLSTLKAYWEGRKELFTGLDIAKKETKWETYPVFHFDFNGQNYQSEGALEEVLDKHLRRWEKIYGDSGGRYLGERFEDLLMAAKQRAGLPAVVLVDEYDKPLLEAAGNSALEEHNKAVCKGFFGTLKNCDEYLRFVLITGVTKFSQVSIFSDLNQLNDISLSPDYADVCGITETELTTVFSSAIRELAQSLDISEAECRAKLKKFYDGYHFAPKSQGVYNPFSLLKAFYDGKPGYYWFSTGTPSFLIRRLEKIHFDVKKFTDGQLYADLSDLSDYRADNPDPVPLLYQTGYLTITDYNEAKERITLAFPNEEVKYSMLSSLLPVYNPQSVRGSGVDIFALDNCVEKGDTEGVRNILTALFATIPYTSAKAPFEHYFETVLYLVFTLLNKYIRCEVHTAQGRADAILETDKFVYIFEFKLDKTAAEALAQIEEKGYALPYVADKRTIYKIGVNFDSAKRSLSEWAVA